MYKPKLDITFGFKCGVCGKRNSLKPHFECMGCADASTQFAVGLDITQMKIIENLVKTGKVNRNCKSYQAAIDCLLRQLDKNNSKLLLFLTEEEFRVIKKVCRLAVNFGPGKVVNRNPSG